MITEITYKIDEHTFDVVSMNGTIKYEDIINVLIKLKHKKDLAVNTFQYRTNAEGRTNNYPCFSLRGDELQKFIKRKQPKTIKHTVLLKDVCTIKSL